MGGLVKIDLTKGSGDYAEKRMGSTWVRVRDFSILGHGDIVRFFSAKQGGYLQDQNGFTLFSILNAIPPAGDDTPYDIRYRPFPFTSAGVH